MYFLTYFIGHKLACTHCNLLHGDVSVNNLLIVDQDPDKRPFTGFLHDFDYSRMGDLEEKDSDIVPNDDAREEPEIEPDQKKERTVSYTHNSITASVTDAQGRALSTSPPTNFSVTPMLLMRSTMTWNPSIGFFSGLFYATPTTIWESLPANNTSSTQATRPVEMQKAPGSITRISNSG